MHSQLPHLDGRDLLTCAVVGGAAIRRRVEHELERRAVRALIHRILARDREPAGAGVETAGAGAPVAA